MNNLIKASDSSNNVRAMVQHPAMDRQFRSGALLSTSSLFFSMYCVSMLSIWAATPPIYMAFYIGVYVLVTWSIIRDIILEDYRSLKTNVALDSLLKKLFKNISQTSEDVLDKTISSVHPREMLLRDRHPANDVVYYPEIKEIVLPILSRKVVFNAFSSSLIITNAFMYFFGVWLTTGFAPIASTILLSFTALLANYFWFLYYNRRTYIKAINQKKLAFVPKRFIDMQYSEAHLMSLIRNPVCNAVLPCYNNTKVSSRAAKKSSTVQMKQIENQDKWVGVFTLEDLIRASMTQTRNINDLISKGVVEPAFLAPEIKTLNHINNFFVVETVRRTKAYLEEHSTYYDIAMRAFATKIGGKLNEEIQSLYKSVTKIDEAINRAKEMHIEDLEKGLLSDENLNKLLEAEIVPMDAFPELHSLRFAGIREKVAAFNIANEAIPKLLKAKDNTADEKELVEIDELIEDVKTYIKGMAIDTDESRLLAEQERLESESGLLGLVGQRQLSEADNVMGEVRNYIQGYKDLN